MSRRNATGSSLRLEFGRSFRRLRGKGLPGLPQRQSLVAQTAGFLRAQIDQGAWGEWLPSERALCELLQVSRNTLRSALMQLQNEGVVQPVHGSGNQIMAGHKSAARPAAQDVALLSPEPVERLRPMQTSWIDDMRALLSERGLRLRVFHGPQYYHATPGPALHKLVTRNPHGCWILMLATEPLQRWFGQNAVPCIVAGSTFPGLDLPFRDLDHRAVCRHAAGVLLGLGHRQLAMMTVKSPRAGDVESQEGFFEAVRGSRHPGADARVIYHDGTVGGVGQATRRLLKLNPIPTALLVVHPYHYLAVVSRLAESGVRVPRDISIISRDDDPFLAFMSPVPARYAADPHVMAKHLLRPVLEVLEGNGVTQRVGQIMPEFLKGESVAAPPAPGR